MWKLIIKNLWNRRKNNGWILAELILVSVLTFVIIDPVVVCLHYLNKPKGYDPERVCLLELARLDKKATQYTTDDESEKDRLANLLRLKDKLANYSDVENTTILSWAYLNSQGSGSNGFSLDSLTSVYPNRVEYFSNHAFFETYGIKSVPGSPSPEELSQISMGENGIIITKDLADLYFPGQNAVGKSLWSLPNRADGDTIFYPIYGVVEPISIYNVRGNTPVIFKTTAEMNPDYVNALLVRVKPGVNMDTFLDKFRPWMVKELKAGNWFARSIVPYEELLENYEFSSGVSNRIRLNVAYAVFFLMNLCLGVIGTFWLQTRKRKEEVGIMLSFGASPQNIVKLLLGEGVILTVTASLIGFFAYFQYAWYEGLYSAPWSFGWIKLFEHDWIHHFGIHFAGMAGIVLIILLIIVSIGVYIPARSLSRVNPINALRDE